MDLLKEVKINKSTITVTSLKEGDEKSYWLLCSSEERLRAIELMRQILYGYDPSSTRLQRILEVSELPRR